MKDTRPQPFTAETRRRHHERPRRSSYIRCRRTHGSGTSAALRGSSPLSHTRLDDRRRTPSARTHSTPRAIRRIHRHSRDTAQTSTPPDTPPPHRASKPGHRPKAGPDFNNQMRIYWYRVKSRAGNARIAPEARFHSPANRVGITPDVGKRHQYQDVHRTSQIHEQQQTTTDNTHQQPRTRRSHQFAGQNQPVKSSIQGCDRSANRLGYFVNQPVLLRFDELRIRSSTGFSIRQGRLNSLGIPDSYRPTERRQDVAESLAIRQPPKGRSRQGAPSPRP